MREGVLLAIGFGCVIGFARVCSLGFVGYLSYETTSSLDPWYVMRTGCELATLALLALAGWRSWFKLGLKSLVTAAACAVASAIIFAVDTSGSTGALVAAMGGVSMAVLMYIWMLLLSSYSANTIVAVTLSGLVLAGAVIEGSPHVGPDVGLVLAVATAFGAGACALLVDPDLRSCTADGPYGPEARARTPWLSFVMMAACGFFVTVLYGVAEYMTWLYDWRPNYIVFGVAALLVIASTAVIVVRARGWMQLVWIPLFLLFALAVVFACLPSRSTVQVAVGLMMAAVFSAHFLPWMTFPSLLSALNVPRASVAGVLLVLTNSSLASLAGDVLGSVLPRSMQNLGSVAGIMAIGVAVLFAVAVVVGRTRLAVRDGSPADDLLLDGGISSVVAAGPEIADAQAVADAAMISDVAAHDGAAVMTDAAGLADAASLSNSDVKESPDPLPATPVPKSPVDALREAFENLGAEFGLTPRELEVGLYTVQGFSCAYIAEKLVVSNSTVRFHQQNVYRKFDVHSRNELIELVSAAE